MEQHSSSLPAPKKVTDDLYVGPQLVASQMAALKAAGFASVINNRPDGEGGPDQPTSAELEAAATGAGLVYRHLPVSPRDQLDADARRMVALVAELPHPTFAFCRTGARAEALYRRGDPAG